MNHKTCPLCFEGELTERNYSGTLVNKGVTAHVDSFLHSVCSCCEVEIADASQTKHNKMLAIEFQRITEGYLPPSEIIRIRKKLRLNSKIASSVIGGGGNAFSKYENGAIKQSCAVDNLLRLLDSHPELVSEIVIHSKQRQVLESYQATMFFQAKQETLPEQPSAVMSWISNIGKSAQSTFETLFKPAVELKASGEQTNIDGSWKSLS